MEKQHFLDLDALSVDGRCETENDSEDVEGIIGIEQDESEDDDISLYEEEATDSVAKKTDFYINENLLVACMQGDYDNVERLLDMAHGTYSLPNSQISNCIRTLLQTTLDGTSIVKILQSLIKAHEPPLTDLSEYVTFYITHGKTDHHKLRLKILHFLIPLSQNRDMIIRCAIRVRKSKNILLTVMRIIFGHQARLEDRFPLRDLCKLTIQSTRNTNDIDVKVASIIERAEHYLNYDVESCTFFFHHAVELELTECLQALLASNHLTNKIALSRMGIFQETIDRNNITTMKILLQNEKVRSFYKTIITNLLSRESPLIKSQAMRDLLKSTLK
jgi:hypothetical protein